MVDRLGQYEAEHDDEHRCGHDQLDDGIAC